MHPLQHPSGSDASSRKGIDDQFTVNEAMCAAMGLLGLTMQRMLDDVHHRGRCLVERALVVGAMTDVPALSPSTPEMAAVLCKSSHSSIATWQGIYRELPTAVRAVWATAIRAAIIDWRAGADRIGRPERRPDLINQLLGEKPAPGEIDPRPAAADLRRRRPDTASKQGGGLFRAQA